MWVIATLVLVASFFTSVGPKRWPGRLALLLPTLWLILQSLTVTGVLPTDDDVINWSSLTVTAVVLPFLAYALVGAVNPDLLHLSSRNKSIIVISVVAFMGIGFVMGARNDLFLTCEEFKVSGNDQPADCRNAPAESAPESLALWLPV